MVWTRSRSFNTLLSEELTEAQKVKGGAQHLFSREQKTLVDSGASHLGQLPRHKTRQVLHFENPLEALLCFRPGDFTQMKMLY